ncbi:MAG: hypothetical protein AVDCRST_MAG02-3763, partial [uncultured Rubrobacteraceae bacterium]
AASGGDRRGTRAPFRRAAGLRGVRGPRPPRTEDRQGGEALRQRGRQPGVRPGAARPLREERADPRGGRQGGCRAADPRAAV